MKNEKLNKLVQNTIVGALYVALTLIFAPISYGPIQLRISEVLIMLPFHNKRWISGIVLGTMIANMFSPLGAVDVVFGTIATLISVILMSKTKNVAMAILIPTLVNGAIIGTQLNLLFGSPLLPSMVYVAVGEALIVSIAAYIFSTLKKNKKVEELIKG